MHDSIHCMTASKYNEIPHIDDQPFLTTSELIGIGELLVKHEAEGDFGVHLLHRHFEIHDDTVMFNFSDGGNQYSAMTSVSDLNSDQIQPSTFLLGVDDDFTSYEYCYLPKPCSIPEPLASELALHIRTKGLQSFVGIERLNRGELDGIWEELPHNAYSTYRTRVTQEDRKDAGKPTAWAFGKGEDGEIRVQVTCSWRSHC